MLLRFQIDGADTPCAARTSRRPLTVPGPTRAAQLTERWLPLLSLASCNTGPGTYVSAPLQIGEVHVGNEENGLCVQIHEGLEDRDVHPLVRGKQRHFNVRDWKTEGDTTATVHTQTTRRQHLFNIKKLKLWHKTQAPCPGLRRAALVEEQVCAPH